MLLYGSFGFLNYSFVFCFVLNQEISSHYFFSFPVLLCPLILRHQVWEFLVLSARPCLLVSQIFTL